ncbi:MAG: glutamate--cysteine ligase, partial [Sphaerospermopsis sp. SIO1G2]|nr:glutamate--cysteine ligase [Sphaerospermopsis sp. SIO1G2]
MFFFGIEHEVAFLNQDGKFADFSCTKFSDFQQIVDQLPFYPDDYPQLRVGDANIRRKRWYIEGFERFADSEEVIDCIGKGIEIRTTINSSIQDTINELNTSFNLLRQVANKFGFSPILISFNPYTSEFAPNPPLNEFEIKQLQADPDEQTAHIYMVSYGPDLNLSIANLPTDKLIDIGKKFTYYSPYIIPFTYSSPFLNGSVWEGLSVRTFIRNGKRPATLVFVENEEQVIKRNDIRAI